MKRGLIIGGVVLTLTLIAVWVYLIFFNTKTGSGLFGSLSLPDTTDDTIVIEELATTTPADTNVRNRLRQLSLKPIIGYSLIKNSSSTPTDNVLFVEAGTGHIFSYNVTAGNETRLSNITIPLARQAVVSVDGSKALVASGSSYLNTITLVNLPQNNTELSSRAVTSGENIISFAFSETGLVLYAVKGLYNTTAYSYDPNKDTRVTLFTVPFREAAIEWGNSANGPHIVFPKPSNNMMGYLYLADKGVLSRLPFSGFGLTAKLENSKALVAYGTEKVKVSYWYNSPDKSSSPLGIFLLPEKCTTSTDNLFCGVPQNNSLASLDAWYQGATQAQDDIWLIDTKSQSKGRLLDVTTEAGRPLDITLPQVVEAKQYLFFINKTDASLWLYEFLPLSNS
jgi:WD40 repeat protein